MKKVKMLFVCLFLMRLADSVIAQDLRPTEDSIFKNHGEIYFKFHHVDRSALDSITRIISIDNYKDGEVFAYANRDEFIRFLQLNIPYEVLTNPSLLLPPEELNMGNMQRSPSNMTIWNFYPTYDQYLNFLNTCVANYPSICKIENIGTSIQGRQLLALKISDSVNYDRGVPQVYLSSSIHGDEITGYVLMLHLIDSLLNSYGTVPRITNMVNHAQIYINPLANPDGTYHMGNNTVTGATRGNANGIDMNRNFPDVTTGPYGNQQQEVTAFVNYANSHHFNLSINFHGGAEVANYPWDHKYALTADDAWWQFVSKEYADTCHKYGTSGYFTNPYGSGYTNGAAWYVITGGRQDYHNYYKHCREVTMEISNTKTPAASTLLTFWKSNVHSFLNYIEQANYGINGQVVDSVTLAPLAAKVFISGHDMDSSHVWSSLPSGWYFRMINNGTWNLTFSCPGYYSRTITVTAARYATTRLNVKLVPAIYSPATLSASSASSSQINLTWTKNSSNDPVMIAFSTVNTFGSLVNGNTYTTGSTIPGGGTILYIGPNTSFSHPGLDPNTTYYYQAWSMGTGNMYSMPVSASATTECGTSGKFPLLESFTPSTPNLPNCWTEETSGTGIVNHWVRSVTNLAGGTASEMRLSRNTLATSATIRLKTYSLNTDGITSLDFSFRHYLDGRNNGLGATIKVQISYDGTAWTDLWSKASLNNANIGPEQINLTIPIVNHATAQIGFVVTGDLSRFDNWYIDDVTVKAPGYWVGGTPGALNDWNTATNWGDGIVPIANTNVYIPLRIFLPLITNAPGSPAQCNNLTISGNAGVTVQSGKAITVNGNLNIQ